MKDIDFKALFNILPADFTVLRANPPDFTFEAATDRYLEAVGKTREEIIGKPFLEIFPNVNGNLQTIVDAFMMAIVEKKASKPNYVRYDIPAPDGEILVKYWSLEYVPLIQNNEVTHVVQLSNDITDLVLQGFKI